MRTVPRRARLDTVLTRVTSGSAPSKRSWCRYYPLPWIITGFCAEIQTKGTPMASQWQGCLQAFASVLCMHLWASILSGIRTVFFTSRSAAHRDKSSVERLKAKVDSGTSHSKSGTSVDSSNSGMFASAYVFTVSRTDRLRGAVLARLCFELCRRTRDVHEDFLTCNAAFTRYTQPPPLATASITMPHVADLADIC